MMQVVPKWKVTVYRGSKEATTFGYSDNFASNVLTAVAKMDFGMDVSRIDVQLEQRANVAHVVTSVGQV